ncbi:MAG: SH3 domain-containing protein [Acutalibacteraceae bacterium]
MKSGKSKNTLVLIISAVLILIAVIIAITATVSSKNKSKEKDTNAKSSENVSVDLSAIANMNSSTNGDNANTNANSNTSSNKNQNSYVFEPGKYKVATKDDPLGLRLEPNTASDRIIYVPKGHEVEVLAVWEDWGYVVYEKTGGWLSMNYLELVSGSSGSADSTTEATAAQQ